MFCKNCGKELENDSKFCNFCGTPVSGINTERKIVYDGDIHKCPNCGEILKSFDIKCPTCGLEVRDRNSSSSIKEFSMKLEKIELERERKKPMSIFKQSLMRGNISQTDEKKINLIRSFTIPNNKEDIFEFIVLAASNIDFQSYNMMNEAYINTSQRAVSEAWVAKMEQAYQKAQISFKNDEDFIQIRNLYEKTNKKLERNKKGLLKFFIGFGVLYIILFLIIGVVALRPEEDVRHERLEYVVSQIEADISNGNYEDARNKAYTLTYDEELNVERHEYWEKKRKNIIEQINEADNNSFNSNDRIEKEEEKSNTETSSNAFIDGFYKGLHSNDEEIKNNIEQFKENLYGNSTNE